MTDEIAHHPWSRLVIESVLQRIPEAVIAILMALIIFGFGLWTGLGDATTRLDALEREQSASRLCDRIDTCVGVGNTVDAIRDCQGDLSLVRAEHAWHKSEDIGWQERLKTLETRVYELTNRTKAMQ